MPHMVSGAQAGRKRPVDRGICSHAAKCGFLGSLGSLGKTWVGGEQ